MRQPRLAPSADRPTPRKSAASARPRVSPNGAAHPASNRSTASSVIDRPSLHHIVRDAAACDRPALAPPSPPPPARKKAVDTYPISAPIARIDPTKSGNYCPNRSAHRVSSIEATNPPLLRTDVLHFAPEGVDCRDRPQNVVAFAKIGDLAGPFGHCRKDQGSVGTAFVSRDRRITPQWCARVGNRFAHPASSVKSEIRCHFALRLLHPIPWLKNPPRF